MMKHIFLFLQIWGLITLELVGQEILFEEKFESWDTVSTCVFGWTCGTTDNCLNNSFCKWNRNTFFSDIGSPDSTGCNGTGYYARSNTLKLQIGQTPFFNTPIINLSNKDSTDSIEVQFCFINGNSLPIDEDGIRVSYSADSGKTWEIQFFDNSRNFNEWKLISLPVGNEFMTSGFQIKFEGIAGNSTGDIGIDDVRVINFSGPCIIDPFGITSNKILDLCSDLKPDSIIFMDTHPDTLGITVTYLISDLQDRLLYTIEDSVFDFNDVPSGIYRIYGIAYIGILQLDSATLIQDVSASVCHLLSSQFLTANIGRLSIDTEITSAYDSSVSCNGASDAQISVNVLEGREPFTYSWNTGENQPILTEAEAGTYIITVSDANQCREVDTIIITEPPMLIAEASITSDYNGSNISCNGAQDGSVFVEAVGGTPPYSYLWSNGSTMDTLTQLGAREYIVFVRDRNGCVSLDSVTLRNPQPLTISAEVISDFGGFDISEPGATDGETQAIATGGTAPYNYAWNTDPPQLSSRAINLGAGAYSVTVVDQNSCKASANVIVSNPGELGAAAIILSNFNGSAISCAGAEDGAVAVIVSGGVPPYTYEWSTNPTRNTDTLRNLGPGTYNVIITDNEGIQVEASVSIEEPAPLSVTAQVQSPACDEDTTGNILLTVSGGTEPYSYLWENGSGEAFIGNLDPGVYSYEVTDANSCLFTGSSTVETGKGIEAEFILNDETCPGNKDGSIITIISSGAKPYDFLWSNGNTSQDLIGVGAGSYWVRIQDSLGCSFRDTLTINSLDSLKIVYSTTPDNGNQTGSSKVVVTGGLPPYQYQWSTAISDTTSSVSGLAIGLYLVTVSDAAGCQISQQIEINPQETQCPPVHSGISPNGDGVNDTWFIPCLQRLGNAEISIYSRQGQELLTLSNYDNTWNGEVDGKELPSGTYFYLLNSRNSGQDRIFKGTITIVR